MYKVQRVSAILNNQRGVSAVIVGICLFMLVSFVALAIDVGHLYVVRNELQNAADAGALAGARHLYEEDSFAINENANQIGEQAATANIGDNEKVEVIFDPAAPQEGDVQRGHWSFNTRTFTRWDDLIPAAIWGKSADELDAMVEFVNAVQVIARRDSLPITSFFGGIFGFPSVKASRKAVAYLGASSGWFFSDFDMPIAVCAQSLVPPDESWEDPNSKYKDCIEGNSDPAGCKLDCNIGRMLNSGSKTDTHNTAGWTNFSGGYWPGSPPEEDSCSTASADDMTDLVDDLCNRVCQDSGIDCASKEAISDPNYRDCCKTFEAGDEIGTTGGVQQVTLTSFRNCWIGASNCNPDDPSDCHPINDESGPDIWNMNVPDEPWKMKLPVVDCPGNNVSNCSELVGAVQVSLMWITNEGTPDPSLDTPYKMRSTKYGENCGTSAENWPTADNYAQQLSNLKLTDETGENRGIPDKYFEPVPVSCPDSTIPQDWPSELPGLDPTTDRLDTPLGNILSRITGGFSITQVEKIAPTAQSPLQLLYGEPATASNATTLRLFDVKDPGDPAPNAPDNICSKDEYEQLLLHHLADAAGEARWASLVDHFKLRNWDSEIAPLAKKSLYFQPTCCGVKPTGLPGQGAAFGIMAKVPVLVD
jgi:hypothetical protein